ncbi:HAD-IA family hydrolase [Brachybacterium sp. AOP25-B2-12]|uniref:HAD-IA family hydrolase n=1 Tax=Brachybacterium sp. AOP25-B2-12 TaxID=3457710 RepID=UPI0040336773
MSRKRPRPSRVVVVFDFGGVLSAGHDPIDGIHALLGGDRETLATAIWDERPAYDRGALTAAEYWGAVAAGAGVDALTPSEVAELQQADDRYWLRLDPESRTLLHDLARHETPLVILSNASVAFGEAVRRADWFEAFAFAVISGEERCEKPDPEIYEILLSALAHESGGVARPGDVVFFDDRADNVAAARALGIDAHRWERNDPARGEAPNPGVAMAREVLAGRGILLD